MNKAQRKFQMVRERFADGKGELRNNWYFDNKYKTWTVIRRSPVTDNSVLASWTLSVPKPGCPGRTSIRFYGIDIKSQKRITEAMAIARLETFASITNRINNSQQEVSK